MGLVAQAQADIKEITSNPDDFGVEITLIAPTSETAVIIGLHTKHHLGIDTDGLPVNSKKAYVSFSENTLIAANASYPIRNTNGEVELKNHRVKVKDSTGTLCQYVIREWFPDEEVGLIVCILGYYK